MEKYELPAEWRRGYCPVSPPWGISEGLNRALTREVVILPLDKEPLVERDKDNIEIGLAKTLYEANRTNSMIIWENLMPDVKEYVINQARAGLRYLESTGIIELEDQRVR